jgi:hypothetical protein
MLIVVGRWHFVWRKFVLSITHQVDTLRAAEMTDLMVLDKPRNRSALLILGQVSGDSRRKASELLVKHVLITAEYTAL